MTTPETPKVANYTTGLRLVQLKDICDRITKGSTPTSYGFKYTGEGIRFIKAENIDKKGLASTTTDHIDHATNEFLKRSILQEDDILFSIAGTIGRVGLIRHSDLPANTNQALAIIRLQPGTVEHKYLFYYLKSDAIQKDALKRIVGVGRANLSLTNIGEFAVPLVPLDQQKLIVAEIEKQFSRLDESVANLKRVKANLKRYKAAVLKAALTGKLTEDWRKQHPDVEPASKLLERILAERRTKRNGKDKHTEPTQPDMTGLPALPAGWTWARLDAIAALKGGITVDKNRKSPTARTVPYLRVANVQRGYLDLTEVKEIKAPETDIRDLQLEPGDILFNEGGDRDKLGRGWVWEGQLSECIHQNHVFRARLYLAEVSPKLVSWWGNSFGQTYFLREGKQTTNLASINITKLSAFPIPLPSAAEQHQIVAEVERRLSIIDELEATVEANLARADRLRQAILQRAFFGALI